MNFKTANLLIVCLTFLYFIPPNTFAQNPQDIVSEIKSLGGISLPTHGSLGKAAEVKETALFIMFKYETESVSNQLATKRDDEYGNLKYQLLKDVWTTAKLCSDNPVLGLQAIIHYPASKWSPVKNVNRQEFFLWCLNELWKEKLLGKNDAKTYINECKEFYPINQNDSNVNSDIIEFLIKTSKTE